MLAASIFYPNAHANADSADGTATADHPDREQATTQVELSRGLYEARFYAPCGEVQGAVVLGSGDGGWSYWEEKVAWHLAKKGWAVAGVDFNAYAETDYTAAILRQDFRSLVEELHTRYPSTKDRPVLYGGWSMGAEQSVAAAAGAAERAPGLKGLLLVAPGARGRYGLRVADRMGVPPTGADTFGLRELAPACGDLRLAIFHAGLDLLDDLNWWKDLSLDARLWTVPGTFHDFDQAGDALQKAMDESLSWLLESPAAPANSSAPDTETKE